MEDGLLLLPAGESVIRISPPLTLTKGEAEKGLAILEACL
jgi:4-aminobutyrate aminotransferase-like enzyme